MRYKAPQNATMGTAVSKVELLQEETKMLQRDVQELQKERGAAIARAEALENDLLDQRAMIRKLNAFASETTQTLENLNREMGQVWAKVFSK